MNDPKTSIASYASSGALVIFGMTANDFAVLLGIIEQKVNEMPFPKLNEEEV